MIDLFSIFPADKDVSVDEFEKLSKYKYLETEVEKLWHMETMTIPVVFGALYMINKGSEKHIEKIPASQNLGEMQIKHLQALLIS